MVWPCREDGGRRGIGLPRECAGSRSVDRPRKRWIDAVKEYLKKRGVDVRETRRMVQDRSEWREFVRGNACGVA